MPEHNRPTVAPELYTEEYFRTACEGYDEFNRSEGEQLSRRLKAAFELAAIRPGMLVLDVGCGRGEILRHCAELGAHAYGIDYAPVAVDMSASVIRRSASTSGRIGVSQANARHLPFPDATFDRVLMFDVVEHLYPWELQEALREVHRVLKADGRFIVHTAPNAWYDRYAYPVVRVVRTLMGQGSRYPANPREFLVGVNAHVHVNEQSLFSLRRVLQQANFDAHVWLDSPPQRWGRDPVGQLRRLLFHIPPFRWFFQREVFAVAAKRVQRIG
ncbi:MAG: class I SAM-dependent methyltransferase [Anaerolineae bacterium]|nr:class I SAM-dependent methyltransferase [Anaerolineae bacterium]